MYEPTLSGLKAFYPKVLPGGIVLFDEFAYKKWTGETSAVEDFAVVYAKYINKLVASILD